MLAFQVFQEGRAAQSVDLTGAFVIGSDDVPLRAEVAFRDGILQCTKRAAGPAGLALCWDVEGAGRILTETVRLQERKHPYVLQVELARGRLLRVNQKLEDWGLLLEPEANRKLLGPLNQARDLLIKALQADSDEKAAVLGQQSLDRAGQVSELACDYVAEKSLEARRQAVEMPRRPLGCRVPLDQPFDTVRPHIAPAFDFVTVPLSWRDIERDEQTFQWKELDAWVEGLARDRVPIRGSALLSFREGDVPDWLYMWEHDFDTIRDLAFEHVRRVIHRYGQHIQSWDLVSGIHGANCFPFNFEQIMELTRMAAAVVKQTAPRSTGLIEIVEPWGEYYARNQRTIPPLLFADMVVQSGIPFDGFGLRLTFGAARDGMIARDMFQISSLLDAYVKLGRPIHVTAAQVPSKGGGTDGGFWHGPWNEDIQAEWVRRFVTTALSKPMVESVSWHSLVDQSGDVIPSGGLIRSDMVPKRAYQELVELRSKRLSSRRGRRGGL